MSRGTPPFVFSALAFLCLGGGFGVAAYRVMQPVPPPPFAPVKAGPARHDPALMQVYVPLEEQLAVAVAEQPVRVMMTLAVSLRAPVADLLALKAQVEATRPALLAALLEVAQTEVARTAEPAVLMAVLPAPLRESLNRRLGTEALPEPVEEVLITGITAQ